MKNERLTALEQRLAQAETRLAALEGTAITQGSNWLVPVGLWQCGRCHEWIPSGTGHICS